MDTDIAFLEELGEDLRAAAVRDSVERAREGRGGGKRQRARRARSVPRWARITAAAAALLTVAGVIGFAVTNGDDRELASLAVRRHAASPAPAQPGGGDQDSVAVPAPADVGYSAGSRSALKAQEEALQNTAGGTEAPESGGILPAQGEVKDLSKIIKTAQLSLLIARDTFGDKFQQATEIAALNGGFVESSFQGRRTGRLLIRVPAVKFDRTRRELKELGVRVLGERIQGQDVTAQFVDYKARLEILTARREALLELLRRANSLEQTLRLGHEVDQVHFRIEEIKGQLNVLRDQVSRATIAVAMREEGVEPAGVDNPSLGSAWEESVVGFLRVIGAVIVGLGYLIPAAVVGGIVWLAVRARSRRGGPPVPREASTEA